MKVSMLSVCALSLVAGSANAQCESAAKAQGCSGEQTAQVMTVAYEGAKKNIVETAVGAGNFGTLVAAVQAAGLDGVLSGEGPFTVFAPTDEAFAALPAGTVESLLKPENKDKLVAILTYHVVPGNIGSGQLKDGLAVATVNGQRVEFDLDHGARIDNAKILATDIKCSNGVIHVIDTVIMPETRSIPQVAEGAGSFGTLLTAVQTAGLSDTLMGEGPFTVFAPTDEAFAELGGTVDELLQPANREKLTAILTYHVVPGRVYSDQALAAGKATTLEGGTITITQGAHGAMVNKADLVTTDIEASNGVIHVIDGVLIPE